MFTQIYKHIKYRSNNTCTHLLLFGQIPLGVMDKDETKIRDMIDVVEAYHQYVPENPRTGKPIPILLYGDGLSCERVNDAQNSRINADNAWDRLDGIQPAIQEWHRRALQLQVHILLIFFYAPPYLLFIIIYLCCVNIMEHLLCNTLIYFYLDNHCAGHGYIPLIIKMHVIQYKR